MALGNTQDNGTIDDFYPYSLKVMYLCTGLGECVVAKQTVQYFIYRF